MDLAELREWVETFPDLAHRFDVRLVDFLEANDRAWKAVEQCYYDQSPSARDERDKASTALATAWNRLSYLGVPELIIEYLDVDEDAQEYPDDAYRIVNERVTKTLRALREPPGTAKRSAKRRGRPPSYDPSADERLVSDWKASKRTKAAFERDRGEPEGAVRSAQDRIRNRRKRG